MKKIISIILVLVLLLSLNVTSFAQKQESDDIDLRLQERIDSLDKKTVKELKSLGFPKSVIMFLSDEEIYSIIENKNEFIGSTESYTLYLTYETERDLEKEKIYAAIPLTKGEKEQYKKNKEAFIAENFNSIDSLKNISKGKKVRVFNENKQEVEMDILFTAMSAGTISNAMDGAMLTLGVNAYDASTSTTIKKNLGLDFQWDDATYSSLDDGMGLAHTASSLGLTNIYSYGGYFYEYYGYQWQRDDARLRKSATGDGIKATLDLPPLKNYGRINIVIGNSKGSVQSGAYFTILGQYAHTKGGIGVTVTLGPGAIGFTPVNNSTIIESDQAWLNNIKTY
ncbi:MAG: hypothetical protein ACOYVK_15580 [Bacillota bacterium]